MPQANKGSSVNHLSSLISSSELQKNPKVGQFIVYPPLLSLPPTTSALSDYRMKRVRKVSHVYPVELLNKKMFKKIKPTNAFSPRASDQLRASTKLACWAAKTASHLVSSARRSFALLVAHGHLAVLEESRGAPEVGQPAVHAHPGRRTATSSETSETSTG